MHRLVVALSLAVSLAVACQGPSAYAQAAAPAMIQYYEGQRLVRQVRADTLPENVRTMMVDGRRVPIGRHVMNQVGTTCVVHTFGVDGRWLGVTTAYCPPPRAR